MRIFGGFASLQAGKSFRRPSLTMFVAILGIVISASSADAYYGHRSYRVNRGYRAYANRNAAVQRALA